MRASASDVSPQDQLPSNPASAAATGGRAPSFASATLSHWLGLLVLGDDNLNQVRDPRLQLALERCSCLLQAVEQAAESVLITDEGGRVVYLNPACERARGLSRQELIGRVPRVARSELELETDSEQVWFDLASDQNWSGVLISRRKDASLCYEETCIAPVCDGNGSIVNHVLVGRDVTRERDLQQLVSQAQKMEAVGRLAGGIAHDFNNIITVIRGYCDLILCRMNADDPLHKSTLEIKRAADRASSMTQQLLSFSRRHSAQPCLVNLNQLIKELEKLLQRLIGEDVCLVVRLTASEPYVHADPSQITQVLINLAANARDAMPAGGHLTIRTSDSRPCEDDSKNQTAGEVGYVAVTVRDSGCGMDAKTRAHLFEPFFTTKAEGRGTGIGLFTVHEIVTQIGGHIEVETIPGGGSSFNIFLPSAAGERQAAERAERPVVRGGTETILVVEDDAPTRQLLTRYLSGLGYRVTDAASGEDALRIAGDQRSALDLAAIDFVLPGIHGHEIAAALRKLHPSLQFLFISGYSQHVLFKHTNGELGAGGEAFLRKPFSLAALGSRIRELLDAAATGRSDRPDRSVVV